nr:MAG TPA: hypothetical protein [Caudoviricetes sp.]
MIFRTINSKAAAKKQPLFCAQKACAQVCPMLKYQRAPKINHLSIGTAQRQRYLRQALPRG